MVEDALTQQRRSYTTQINRSKKHGREFIILLLDASGTPDGT
jgi:DNA anti-recombination protein RmuC